MDLSIKDTINIRVVNNTSLPQSVNLLGSTSDPLGVPPSLLYQWDLSSETFFGSVSASIVISNTSNPTPTTYTVQVDGYNIEAVVFALNTLNLGFFQYSGDIVYVSNDFYIYGALTISSTSFVSSWNTSNTSGGSSASNQIQLPLVSSGSYNFIVDWGDGNQDTITTWNQAETLHTYATSGTYTISLTGTIEGFVFGASGDILKILSVINFGNIIFGDTLLGIFNGCTNLSFSSVIDTPDLSTMTRLDTMFEDCTFSSINNLENWDVSTIVEFESMFRNCSNFNQNISSWDVSGANSLVRMFNGASVFNSPLNSWNVSNVTTLNGIFNGASAFNQNLNSWDVSNVVDMTNVFRNASAFNGNISSWNVSSVTDMRNMFDGATSFNGNISSWNVGNVTNMASMFSGATAFNQDIGSWNVSSVINMSGMFADALAFNQSLNNWNVSNVTNMSSMFSGANAFNKSLNSWNVSNVTDMSRMFDNTTNFNQDISSWDVGNVTDISFMFYNATNFNQDINSWDVGNVTDISSMFSEATAFNQDIGDWDVSSVTNMSYMFSGATAFNQDISGWDVSSVTNMSYMFSNATSFNQDIGGWDINNVLYFFSFMDTKTPVTFSTTNLNSIYNGWSSIFVQPNIFISFGTAKYTIAGQAGKNILTGAPNNWVITDGGI